VQGQGLERELTTLVRLPCWEGKGGIYAAVNDGRDATALAEVADGGWTRQGSGIFRR